jgi:Ni,Fe-hydrogenase III component G
MNSEGISTARLLEMAGELLLPWTERTDVPVANRLDVIIKAADLPDAARKLYDSDWGYLVAITGLDLGPEVNALEVLYHFGEGAAVVTLRVTIPRENATIPSVCHIIPAAVFFERELSEMFGIVVEGLVDPSRLFLPDEWPADTFPLRKDFTGLELLTATGAPDNTDDERKE